MFLCCGFLFCNMFFFFFFLGFLCVVFGFAALVGGGGGGGSLYFKKITYCGPSSIAFIYQSVIFYNYFVIILYIKSRQTKLIFLQYYRQTEAVWNNWSFINKKGKYLYRYETIYKWYYYVFSIYYYPLLYVWRHITIYYYLFFYIMYLQK